MKIIKFFIFRNTWMPLASIALIRKFLFYQTFISSCLLLFSYLSNLYLLLHWEKLLQREVTNTDHDAIRVHLRTLGFTMFWSLPSSSLSAPISSIRRTTHLGNTHNKGIGESVNCSLHKSHMRRKTGSPLFLSNCRRNLEATSSQRRLSFHLLPRLCLMRSIAGIKFYLQFKLFKNNFKDMYLLLKWFTVEIINVSFIFMEKILKMYLYTYIWKLNSMVVCSFILIPRSIRFKNITI